MKEHFIIKSKEQKIPRKENFKMQGFKAELQ